MTTSAASALSSGRLEAMDGYWRAANYLSVGQIYLKDNPLLAAPLTLDHIKPRLLGHWGTTPGLNFLYVHLNRLITDHDLDMIAVIGPGHGGPGLIANTYLEGSYTERYPAVDQSRDGLRRLFRQFSWPHGVPSHVSPDTPGSIHEGGELGYCLSHAYGAAFDNPDLVVACVVGDGEAETGPLAASWHANKFLNPARDGAVLPILHLNGFKIANPTILARIDRADLIALLRGYGYEPHMVEGDDPALVHQALAATLDRVLTDIRDIQTRARSGSAEAADLPRWPMIVFSTPKGWTGPKVVDGLPVEGTWRAHQVPLDHIETDGHLRQLEAWMRSYRPHELFDAEGRLQDRYAVLAPKGRRRMGSNPHANGGEALIPLILPSPAGHAVAVAAPGAVIAEATRALGGYLGDVMALNRDAANFRLFGPNETASNRLEDVYAASGKTWMAALEPVDLDLSRDGRVMEVLSEHLCEGWLEGYLLTGRHGLFSCYEAFVQIVDSMVNQHAKWLKACQAIPWRAPIASLNYLLTSHVWRQDHNGFSHQDPGFLDHVANKGPAIVRLYLPPDANCLLAVTDHCLRSRDRINVIVAGKQPEAQWLGFDDAVRHCQAGLGVWAFASNDDGGHPDVVMACAGDVPTLETLAAVSLLRRWEPHIRIRLVNVVDLLALQSPVGQGHGLNDHDYEALFPTDVPVIFAFHGYPALIHSLIYRRANHDQVHVHGFRNEGTTTTPFDMVVLNGLDRYRLALDALGRIPRFADRMDAARARYWATMERHTLHIGEHGEDLPEVRNWRWRA